MCQEILFLQVFMLQFVTVMGVGGVEKYSTDLFLQCCSTVLVTLFWSGEMGTKCKLCCPSCSVPNHPLLLPLLLSQDLCRCLFFFLNWLPNFPNVMLSVGESRMAFFSVLGRISNHNTDSVILDLASVLGSTPKSGN